MSTSELSDLKARLRKSKGYGLRQRRGELEAILVKDPPTLDTSQWKLPMQERGAPPIDWKPPVYTPKPVPKKPSRWAQFRARVRDKLHPQPEWPSTNDRESWIEKSRADWEQYLLEHGDED